MTSCTGRPRRPAQADHVTGVRTPRKGQRKKRYWCWVTCKAPFVSKEESPGRDGRQFERKRDGGVLAPTQTTNRSPPPPPTGVRAAHASHFMNSISTGRNFQFERAIITAWGGGAGGVNCFCSIMHSDAIIFLSNYRGVSAACHPGADFQFN